MQKKKIRLSDKQIERAKELEREAMEGMDSFPVDKGDEQRRFRNIMEELREKGLLTEEEEQQVFGEGGFLEQEKMPLRVEGEYQESPDLHKNRSWRKLGRAAAMFAVVLVGIFAACMTSEANRRTVMNAFSGWMGNNTRVMVDNDVGSSDRNISEEEARMKIAGDLEVEVPYMSYKPKKMVFEEYELYSELGCAMMHYSLDGNSLTLQVVADTNEKKGSSTLKGDAEEDIKLYQGNIITEVYREENSEGNLPTMSARWEYDNTYYQLVANVEEQVFKKILMNFRY